MPTCAPTWVDKSRARLYIPFACLLAFMLTACRSLSIVILPDPETSQEHNLVIIDTASKEKTVGQTFIPRRPQLTRLTLWVRTSSQTGSVQVGLYHSPTDDRSIFTQVIPFEQITNGALVINLPISTSAGQPYYILLRPLNGTLQVRGSSEDTYPFGQAYSDQSPLDGDLTFTTAYNYDLVALFTDLRASLPHLWLVLPFLVILILPGWLLLEGSGLARGFDDGERIALSVGMSLSLIPLTMLWSTTFGLRWGRTGLLVTAAFVLVLTAWQITRPFILRKQTSQVTSKELKRSPKGGKVLTDEEHRIAKAPLNYPLLGVFFISLVVRLIMSRDLAAPAWVDSIHHATLTRLILEHGGFPATYAPYIDIDAAQYHAGFHSLLATFQWLSGMEAPESMLLFGQVLNAFIVYAAYLMTVTLTRQRATGVIAGLIAGLFTPMPAYYTSWGRYTQLAGLLILPVGLAMARMWIECDGTAQSRKYIRAAIVIFGGIACGGVFLVHYRVMGFLALLFLAFFISHAHGTHGRHTKYAQNVAIFGLAIGVLGLLITLPWSWRAITQVFLPKAGFVAGNSAVAFEGFIWEYLTTAWGLPAMLLAGLGFIISLFRRISLAVCMVLWIGLLLLASNLSALHLPGSWFVSTASVAISLFLPTAVLAGYGLGQIYEFFIGVIRTPWKTAFQWVTAAALFTVAMFAARALLPILRTSTELFRQADRPAMKWIAENIPVDETILINPMYWGYKTYAGADGGYWITPLTGRKTLPPPVLYALGKPLEKQRIQTMCEAIIDESRNPARLAKYLREHGIYYVFLGARGGVISAQALRESDKFELLYAKQGAWIFRVR